MTFKLSKTRSKILAAATLIAASFSAQQALGDSNRVCADGDTSNCYLTGEFPPGVTDGLNLSEDAKKTVRFVDGDWYIGGTFLGTFSGPNWIPIVGDWDNDGFDNIGVYRNGLWIFKMSWNFTPSSYDVEIRQYGDPTWTPIPGDWNNDGYDSLGIYKDGVFKLLRDSSDLNSEIIITFNDVTAGSTAVPVAGDFGKPEEGGEDRVGLVDGSLGKYVQYNIQANYDFYTSSPGVIDGGDTTHPSTTRPVVYPDSRLLFGTPPTDKQACPSTNDAAASLCIWLFVTSCGGAEPGAFCPNDGGRTVVPDPPPFGN